MKIVPRILVVDDEEGFRTLLKCGLEDEGYKVTEASNGEEAIILSREHTYDLALLDLRMPGINGIEVLKVIREVSPSTDCVMITGYQDVQLAVEAIKLGAKDFLPKPQNLDELINRIKNVLRAHTAEAHITEIQADFTSKLLHDLLAPLHSLRSAIDFLEQGTAGQFTDQQKNIFQSINSTIKYMDALLSDMIDLSLFESGRVDINKIPTNFDELIPAVCARFIPQTNSKKIVMDVKVNNNVPTIAVDPEKIEQVMINLLDNAIKYTPEGGSIQINVSSTTQDVGGSAHEFAEVTVTDTGVGISRGELPLVFDKYKEVLTGKSSEKKTTGLGLAICKSVVEAHGGKMYAESTLGKGSTFKILLPTESL